MKKTGMLLLLSVMLLFPARVQADNILPSEEVRAVSEKTNDFHAGQKLSYEMIYDMIGSSSVKRVEKLAPNVYAWIGDYLYQYGIEIDVYTKKGYSHSYLYSYDDKWRRFKYSDKEKKIIEAPFTYTGYYNLYGNMYWRLTPVSIWAITDTGYHINTKSGKWEYTLNAYDIQNGGLKEVPQKIKEVRDDFYEGICVDHKYRAGLRNINWRKYYLLKDGTILKNGKRRVNGKTYLFGADGKCYKSYESVQEGWIKKQDGYYWLQDDNTILRTGGWQILGGNRYFLAYKSGRRKTGWQTWKQNRYYLSPVTGIVETGLKTIDGNTYYFQDKTGEMTKGWKKIHSHNYYFNETTGVMKRGMLSLYGKKYYFETDGTQHFGWRSLGGKRYYFDKKTGAMTQNNWIIDGKNKYYANKNGTRFSNGIRSIKYKNYYFGPDGKLVTNKRSYKIKGKLYNIDKNGVLTKI